MALIVYKWIAYDTELKSIKQNFSLVKGYVRSYGTDGKGAAGWFYYYFRLNGRKYENSISDHGIRKVPSTTNAFLEKSFYVAYDSANPKFNEILIFPSQFEKYDIPFPDSLQWVKNFLKHN